jgi:hypothetical protein
MSRFGRPGYRYEKKSRHEKSGLTNKEP